MPVEDRVNKKLRDYYEKQRMWLTVRGKFDAAHYIKGHPKCGTLHGHTFKVEVHVSPKHFIDFGLLDKTLEATLKDYDHNNLGDITAEEIAEQILKEIANVLSEHVNAVTVDVYETEKYSVRLRNW